MGASPKRTINLSDGQVVNIDVSTLTRKELRGFFDPRISDKTSDKVLARLSSTKLEYIEGLLNDDYRRILDTVIELANRPLDNPNSVSESISE